MNKTPRKSSRRLFLERIPKIIGAASLSTSPLLLAACQTSQATSPPSSAAVPSSRNDTARNDTARKDTARNDTARIDNATSTARKTGRLWGARFESTPWSFSTNSYVVEGPTGLILIDTQFLTSEANAFVDAAQQATQKPVEVAIVLHANPDKFNGTAALQKRGIRVVTSAQVAAHIPSIHKKRVRAFSERYRPDYPLALPQPEIFGEHTKEIEGGGTSVTAHVMGAGCSAAHVVVSHDNDNTNDNNSDRGRDLFVGDLVANGSHSWLEIGQSKEWLKRVGEMGALNPARVHPGRGPSGDVSSLIHQAQYLQDVRRVVADVVATEPEERSTKIAIERMIALYPNLKFPVFLRIGIPAELKAARAR